MTGIGQSLPVSSDEKLARFITASSWLRADRTIKQDAFIPPKDLQLSVTRHLNLSEAQIWQIGQSVIDAIAEKRTTTFHGRADLNARTVSRLALVTQPAPLQGNPNHAHITGWPLDKPTQKIIAQQLAAMATFVQAPAPA